jgi:DNA-binding transcriptional LysR family regulator
MLGRGQQFRAQVEAAFAQCGIMPRVQIETHTVASACALAARGVGVAIVNEDLARGYMRGQTVLRPFSPAIRHEYAFAVSSAVSASRLADAFFNLMPGMD